MTPPLRKNSAMKSVQKAMLMQPAIIRFPDERSSLGLRELSSITGILGEAEFKTKKKYHGNLLI